MFLVKSPFVEPLLKPVLCLALYRSVAVSRCVPHRLNLPSPFAPSCSTFQVGIFFGIFSLQGSTNRRALGLVNFVPALAYHICLNLPVAFTQPGARLLVEPCT